MFYKLSPTVALALYFALGVNAAINDSCFASGTPGVCLTTSSCSSSGGTSRPGFCPNDPTNVQCCTKTCGSGGTCRFANTCTGTTQTGLCPGPSNFVCCLPSSGGGGSCSTGPAVNAATISLIKQWEGFVASPAPDPIGLPTVGYGHLCKTTGCAEVPYSFPLTTTTATQLLYDDLVTYQNCVTKAINVKLNANQYGALVSWAFNVGCGAIQTSSLVSRLNAGQTPNTVASEELIKWVNAGGVKLPGLVNRRNAEITLFKTASSANGINPC